MEQFVQYTLACLSVDVAANNGTPQTPQQPKTPQPQQPSKLEKFCGNLNLVNNAWGAFNVGLGGFALIPEPVEPGVALVAGVSGLANGISAGAQWVFCP